MQLKYLNEFIILTEIKNYSDVSEELFISQSTLSKHIKELEAEIGGPLFKRTTRKVELTELGMFFLPYAKNIEKVSEEAKQVIANYFKKRENIIKIGIFSHGKEQEISRFLMKFQTLHSDIHLELINAESEQLYEMIDEGLCDFIFVREKTDSSDIHYSRVSLFKDPLTAYIYSGSKYSKQETIKLSDLKNELLLFSEEGSLSYELGMEACLAAGFQPNVFFKGNRLFTLNYVKEGLGIALMIGDVQSNLTESEVILATVYPQTFASINLLFRKKNINPVQQKFLDFTYEYLKN